MHDVKEATIEELIRTEEAGGGSARQPGLPGAPLARHEPDLPSAPGANDWPKLTPGKIQVLGPFAVPGLVPRRVRLYVPADFDLEVPRFTLYLFDGQNVFDDQPSYAGGWYAHEAAERLARAGKLAPVLVGIDHGGAERIRELSPFPVQGHAGQLDTLLDWLLETLKPALAKRLSLIEGPAGSAVGGSSMGGLAATYAHFRRPEELGGALVMSPSFWIGEGAILDWVIDQPRPPHSRIYLDSGMREGRGTLLPLVARLAGHLAARGYGDLHLRFRTDPKGLHSEQSWRRRFPAALRFLYR